MTLAIDRQQASQGALSFPAVSSARFILLEKTCGSTLEAGGASSAPDLRRTERTAEPEAFRCVTREASVRTKVLFDSDYPVIPPDRWIADFEKLPIKADVRPLIMRENAIRLLGFGNAAV